MSVIRSPAIRNTPYEEEATGAAEVESDYSVALTPKGGMIRA
jgi:hypothetical protein